MQTGTELLCQPDIAIDDRDSAGFAYLPDDLRRE